MLKLEIVVHDQQWPFVNIVMNRQTSGGQVITTTEKVQYDLAYDKAEVMAHNQLRPMVTEIIQRRKRLNG